jgi:hypothetical protein
VRTDSSPLSDWLSSAWARDSTLSSPKLASNAGKTANWYRYYAGYADTFVADVVARLPEPPGTILDPWNGSGTTTSVAAVQGISARGFDINPAAVVISKARLLQSHVAPSLLPLTAKLLATVEASAPLSEDDLLLRWMTPRAASAIRRLTSTINRSLVDPDDAVGATRLASEMSSLAALFYLAVFRVVRRALTRFSGTNPTWLRQKVTDDEKVDLDLRTLRPWLLAAMEDLADTVDARGLSVSEHGGIDIAVADSGALPMPDGAAEAVITSPPYCTRIDYAVATLPELAALGMTNSQFRALRDRLIGTPTRDGSFPHSDVRWGSAANGFLSQVADHQSRASQTYYLSFFSQYFAGMWRSLSEIGRVVARDRPIVLVVQDSFYKELHADIPRIMCEMSDRLGWSPLARRDFQVRTKANINAATRKYRQPSLATESVLAFQR